MSSSSAQIDRPVRLPRRSRQGIVLGMDAGQVGFLATAGVVVLAALGRFGPVGLVYTAPIYLTLGAASVISVRGISAPRLAGLWLLLQVRHAAGATTQKYRPEGVHLAGTLNLPGVRASVQLWEAEGIACVYNPGERSVSVTAELEVQGFLMHDTPERLDLAQQWSRVLAAFTQRPGIKRVTLQERTLPTTIKPAREHFEEVQLRRGPGTGVVVENYQRVMDTSERFAVAHRNFLTFTLNLVALEAQVKALGGGKDAIIALATIEAGNLSDALSAATIKVRRWLSVRDIAALARVTFDPAFAATVQNRTGPEDSGVDPIGIGPMYLEEPRGRNGVVYSESGIHSTMWIHEWPLSDAPVGFISPLVFARHPGNGESVTHILSIVLTPVPVHQALKRIRTEKKVWRGNERLRAKRRVDGSAADAADWEALQKQEEEIVEGHGEFRYGAYLTVTAAGHEELDRALAGTRNALSRAGMEAQTLYCQQAEALLVNALPLGTGMK